MSKIEFRLLAARAELLQRQPGQRLHRRGNVPGALRAGMFCVVVPMVFVSISSAIANMQTLKRAGKLMGVTVVTFLVTAAIAAILMYIVVSVINIVPDNFNVTEMVTKTQDVNAASAGDLIVNFFTKPDFSDLLSRKAMSRRRGGGCGGSFVAPQTGRSRRLPRFGRLDPQRGLRPAGRPHRQHGRRPL